MHNILKRTIKILAITLGTLFLVVVLLVGALSMWLNTDEARQIVFQKAIEMLEDKLQTRVKADSISIRLLQGQVRLYGMQVNDREDSLLLGIEELHVGIEPHALLDHRVVVTDAELIGADARLWRDSLTSNYQFVIDAFKKKPGARKQAKGGKAPKMELVVDVKELNLERLHARWDVRHKLRKNIGKPHRGAFDANHVDVDLSMKAKVTQPAKGTYDISISDLTACDRASGLQASHLNLKAQVDKEKIKVSELLVRMLNSYVKTEPFTIDLRRKAIVKPFTLTAQVLLQDLAQPFAPVLGNFTTPLQLTTQVSGPLRCLNVDDIRIQTPDGRLRLTAWGRLDGLFGKKEGLNLQFRDIDMHAKHNMKEQIVMHFAKKMRLKMIRQMKALGDIRFQGTVDVLYKREVIGGRLSTRHGDLTTQFTIDGFTRYMTGYLQTSSMDLGKVMNIADLGPVKCRVDFDLNISRKTPRPATALPNGRLPMGKVTAKVYNARYSTLTVPDVKIDLVSDGSTARGTLRLLGVLEKMAARVRYIQTDTQQSVWFQMTHAAQQWLLQESTAMLSDKLKAEVEADSIDMHIFSGAAKIYGIRVKDRHKNPLFSLDTLRVKLNAQELMHHQKVRVTHLGLYGMHVQLNKDSVESNFRFIMQSFGKKKPAARRSAVADKQKKNKRLQLVVDVQELLIEDMQVVWDVKDRPRKNLDRPNRGAFDANHIDVLLDLEAGIRQVANGYAIDLRRMNLTDRASGLHIEDMHTFAIWSKGRLRLVDGLHIQLPQSWISTEPLVIDLRKKRFVRPFVVQAHVVLQDIAEPFAPMLSSFTTPLDVTASISGDLDGLQVQDLALSTTEGHLELAATGLLKGLTGPKDSLNLSFRDVDMRTDNATLMQLVSHFAKKVRLKMVRQMKALGDIHFNGNLDVLYKRENFYGRLATEYGGIETDFVLDDNTHYMTGYLETTDLDVGKFLNIKRLGAINAHIDFNFNISSKTPRPVTALPNGRLPQGHVNAYIRNARYGFVRAKSVEADVNSDGSTATGSVVIPKGLGDLIVNFNYIQTDEQQHLKFKPKFKFHIRLKKRKKTHHHHHHHH